MDAGAGHRQAGGETGSERPHLVERRSDGLLGEINGARNPRPVILLISDGGENSSRASLADIVTTRRQSETQVYAFGVVSPASAQRKLVRGPDGSAFDRSSPPSVDVLPRIIGDSGGVEYRVSAGMDAASVARAFVDDLRFQYTIGYTPIKALDGKYRRVKVEMKKRGFKIRHRGGYLAVPGGAATLGACPSIGVESV